MMRLTYDADVDALYVRVTDAAVARQAEQGDLIVDFDEHGGVVGFEVIGASQPWDTGPVERLGVDPSIRQIAAVYWRPDFGTVPVGDRGNIIRSGALVNAGRR